MTHADTAEKVRAFSAQILSAQQGIAKVQLQCKHQFRLVKQENIAGDVGFPTMCVETQCSVCELSVIKNKETPICPKHLTQMVEGRDEISLQLRNARHVELQKDRELDDCDAFVYKCTSPECEERMVLVLFDQ